MARRPSTISVVSFGSSKGVAASLKSPTTAQASLSPSISVSKLPRSTSSTHPTNTLNDSKLQDEIVDLDPDELFTKCTIAEVKAKQVQLRADAEAKQEELRIMVGERYRDLLQASTSIIALAKSARRVQAALDETRTAIRDQEQPPEAKRSLQASKEDAHLQTLQTLSAHIKLLLDAPEHLWRLIERERYFQAAWLFLLARVVHRALQADEENWINQGISILDQFPLIQRQWETVSQFRTQIIHKSTLSLRVFDRSAEETCATLLTLHILDSRPLTDTLSTYLAQRSKTLSSLLSKTNDVAPASTTQTSTAEPSKASRAAKTSLHTALDAIIATINTARAVFQGDPSLSIRVLEYIQSDSTSSSTAALPTELRLTTQTLLSTLPSSTHFTLLPSTIKSYKPYVDLSSPSSSLPPSTLHQKLIAWFSEAQKSLGSAAERWIGNVQGIRAAWGIRCTVRTWLNDDKGKELQESEREALGKLVDGVVRNRIVEICKEILGDAERKFEEEIQRAMENPSELEASSPLNTLYKPVAVPSSPGLGSLPSIFDKHFHKYRSTIQQRLSPSLIGVLNKCAEKMKRNFNRIEDESRDDGTMIAELYEIYRPEAAALCIRILDLLSNSIDHLIESYETISSLIFIARIANDFASPSSAFTQNIGCEENVARDFRDKSQQLFDRAISRWKEHTVAHAISKYVELVSHLIEIKSLQLQPTGPSSALTGALFALSSAIYSLGLSHHPTGLKSLVVGVLRTFCAAFANVPHPQHRQSQTTYDLALLRKILHIWEGQNSDDGIAADMQVLDKAISKAQSRPDSATALSSGELGLDSPIDEYLARTQLMLGMLLPQATPPPPSAEKDSLPPLLSYGVPTIDAQFHSAVKLAKPSARFGLLLVENR
ncbi:hypothetical protein BJ138DRAFT_1158672 [Hygrophoropsis aurantiaca]|uniref:Uncharacterized protein n=1 Tax=Hygrophoropsis aurantiaca TaxID=72124 RepID=A0ACB8A4P1_9AGAM|nr:hypothetical protein BJ138DRAFT_1158672 [Hygrophoropsis aurantiaca]